MSPDADVFNVATAAQIEKLILNAYTAGKRARGGPGFRAIW